MSYRSDVCFIMPSADYPAFVSAYMICYSF